jgi:hypothetical protein
MNDRQRRRFERLVRSRDAGVAYNASFPATSVGGKAITNISSRIDEIENLDAARSTHQRTAEQGTSFRSDARAALRAQLAAISNTADAIALDFPEFKDKFRRPRTNINDQTLLTTGRSFHTEATPVQARFIEYDMPANFLETLNDVIANFEQSINQQNVGASGRRSNSVAIDAALADAEQDLEKLDTAFRNKFAGDEAALAAWEAAHRMERASKKTKTPKEPPPTQ